jgi:lipid II:glycine glycyltransferase (peptidoglycan interpeptide bridge formation enzyme)
MGRWNYEVLSTQEKDFEIWQQLFARVDRKDMYSRPEYIRLLEEYYGDQAEVFYFGDEDNYVIHAYFKKEINKLPFFKTMCTGMSASNYYDLITSWYYGGPLVVLTDSACQEDLMASFITSFDEFCRDKHYISEFIRFDPILENHKFFAGLLELKQNRKVVYIDLSQDEETIWERFKGRCRTSVRKARRSGITVRHATTEEEIGTFSNIYVAEMRRKNAPRHYRFSHSFFINFFTRFKDDCSLFVAEMEGQIIGATLCIHKYGIVHDYLMASMPDYWRFQPNNLLLYEAILWSKRSGYEIFDLQGGRDNVYKFKKAFSPTTKDFFVCSIVHDQVVYDKFCQKRREYDIKNGVSELDPASADFFPAYRRRELVTKE